MSRRSIPPIHPADLRDHADPERVERIWERLEHDLAGAEATVAAPPRLTGTALLLLAAALGAFAGGVVVGRRAVGDPGAAAVAAVASADGPAIDVFAAGTHGRSFPLPGGGQITLSPGATVEVVRTDADALTLRLVQGEANVDTNHGVADRAVAIVAGDARLATQAGSVLDVRRDDEHLDVKVASGVVSITSPAGSQRLGGGERADAVPLHAVVVATPAAHGTVAARRRALPSSASAPDAGAAVAAAPDWKQRWQEGDWSEGFKLLRQQPGGAEGAIAAAKSAEELMTIVDVARAKGGDNGIAISALTRVVNDFPGKPEAPIAARALGDLYERAGEPEKALAYRERAQTLSPRGFWGEDACNQIRAELKKGRTDEGARAAQEYLSKFPDGQCKDDADRLLRGEAIAEPADAPGSSGKPDAKPSP
jgi:hypothetical protein